MDHGTGAASSRHTGIITVLFLYLVLGNTTCLFSPHQISALWQRCSLIFPCAGRHDDVLLFTMDGSMVEEMPFREKMGSGLLMLFTRPCWALGCSFLCLFVVGGMQVVLFIPNFIGKTSDARAVLKDTVSCGSETVNTRPTMHR